MKSKYTKRAHKSGNKKSMKMSKTRKERKVKSRNVKSRKMKPQVGGGNGEMDPDLYDAVKNKNGALAIMLINSRPDLGHLRTRQEIQDFAGDQEETEKNKYEELLDVMDQYKYDKFNELKEDKNKLTNIILTLINPLDLSRYLSIKNADGSRRAVKLEL